MDDLLATVLAIAVVIAVLVGVAYVLGPGTDAMFESSVNRALERGEVAYRMTQEQVISVWGEPHDVQINTLAEQGFLGVLPEERMTWIYYSPYRTVTFVDEGLGPRVERISGQ